MHYREEFGLETRVVRFHNIFGPQGTWEGGREKAPAALCRKVAVAKLAGPRVVEIWGDGEQTRSFCFIEDCTKHWLMPDYHSPAPVAGSPISINGYLTVTASACNPVERKHVAGPVRPAPQPDNSRLAPLLGATNLLEECPAHLPVGREPGASAP
jgi:nucleoside-diphosphate-sugar epimerase